MNPSTLSKLLSLGGEMDKFMPKEITQEVIDVLLPNFHKTGLKQNASVEQDYETTKDLTSKPPEMFRWKFLYFATCVTHVFLKNLCPVSVFPFQRKEYVWIDIDKNTFNIIKAPAHMTYLKVQYKNERYAVNLNTGVKIVSSKGLYLGIEPMRPHPELDLVVVISRKSQYETCFYNGDYQIPTVIHIL